MKQHIGKITNNKYTSKVVQTVFSLQKHLVKLYLKKIDFDVSRLGIQEAARHNMKNARTKIKTFGIDKALETCLKQKPVILISNHPHEFDPIMLLASLPSREDCFLIVQSQFMRLGKHISKYLIPVYIDHHYEERKHKFIKEVYMRKLCNHKTLTPEEEHQKNIESIRIAASKVSQNGMVIIFPESKEGPWQKGVGHLIAQVKNPEMLVILAHISNTSDYDYLRFMPKSGKLLPQIAIHFSKPILVSELKKTQARDIVLNLEKKYKQWSSVLEK